MDMSEAMFNFDYTQTVPDCAVSCKYESEFCKDERVCHMQEFSNSKRQFMIVRSSLTDEYHDSIVCTSEQSGHTITNHFKITQEPIRSDTCEGPNDSQMLLGSASQINDFDYELNGLPKDIQYYVQHIKAGCGLECSVSEPEFIVETDASYWSDPISLSKEAQRLTFNVESRGQVSIGLGQTERCKKNAEYQSGCFEVQIREQQICLQQNRDVQEQNIHCITTGESNSQSTVSLEWTISRYNSEIHYLNVNLYEHHSHQHIEGQWALETGLFARDDTSFKFINFNAKGRKATFFVWLDDEKQKAPSWIQSV